MLIVKQTQPVIKDVLEKDGKICYAIRHISSIKGLTNSTDAKYVKIKNI